MTDFVTIRYDDGYLYFRRSEVVSMVVTCKGEKVFVVLRMRTEPRTYELRFNTNDEFNAFLTAVAG